MKRLNTQMNTWTYRPWHLVICSPYLICIPKWSHHLQIQLGDFFFLLFWKISPPQCPVLKLIDWLIAIWPNSRTHKKCFQPFFQKFRRKAKRRPFGGMFQSILYTLSLHFQLVCLKKTVVEVIDEPNNRDTGRECLFQFSIRAFSPYHPN